MALLLQKQQAVSRCSAQPRVALLRPQPLVQRSRVFRAVNVNATTKAPAQPVKITIQGRRLPVTDAIRQYVEEKINKAVANYAHNIKKIDVTISARGGDTGTQGAKQQKVDVTITTLRSGVVRVEDSEESLYASIDLVCDKVSRKLRKVKERLIGQGAWPGKGGPRVNTEEEEFKEYMDNVIVEAFTFSEEESRAAELAAPSAAAALPTEVVRSKVVSCEPMDPEEAIYSLEAVGHDFYVYRDKASSELRVMYKRENGGYGVLIPQ
ncbi:chloroplast-specific ribosomal protein [Scenedesmus sp. NREL 46B-D3]|nr:chloroplast-specific ribosomal protein [Scenedesmus sp. NREL 46B-D3]